MEETQRPLRSRTFGWADPAPTVAELGRRSGLAVLQAILAGELPGPPAAELIAVTDMTVAEGRVTVGFAPQEFHYNPLGTVHGGILATVLDTATGCAVFSTLPAGAGYTSLDLTAKFLRAVTAGSGRLTCVGTVLQRGRQTALAEARMTDEADRLVAYATSSCLLFPIPA